MLPNARMPLSHVSLFLLPMTSAEGRLSIAKDFSSPKTGPGAKDWYVRRWAKNGRERPRQCPGLFDHLVGANQNRSGYLETERLGGLEVHDHLKLGWKLHWEIARLLAA